MKMKSSMLAVLALTGLAAVAACDKVAPPAPEPTPGPSAASNALNGTYNLLESQCGTEGSDTGLVIDGNRLIFPGSTCTVVSSTPEVNRIEVTLSCEGANGSGNRIVSLQSRPGILRMTEQSTSVNYFQCSRARASSDSLVGQTL